MALADAARARLGKVFYGWWVVAASSVANGVGGGVYFYGFSVFFLPIKEALGLSSAATSLVFSLARAQGAFEGPITGYLIDRIGPRIIFAVGVTAVGVGYVLLSQVNSFTWFLVVYLGLVSLGFNASFSSTALAVVNNWFIRRKSLAMSIPIAAFDLGGGLITPPLALGILHLGWRTTAALSGIFLVATVLPFAYFLRRSPESMGLRPYGETPTARPQDGSPATSRATVAPRDYTIQEALRTPAFWLLAVGTLLRTGAIGSLIVHFVPIMVWKGVSAPAAALMLGAMAFLSMPIGLAIGWLGDRIPRARLLATGLAVGAAALLVLQGANSRWHLWAYISMLAVLQGLSTLNWALVGDYFGRARFATLRGILGLVYSWGLIILPVLAGVIFDRTESYAIALWVFLAMFVAGAALFALIRPPRPPTRITRRGSINAA